MIQQQLALVPVERRGGARKKAGRKPADPSRRRVPHLTRPVARARFAFHITKRMRRDIPRLRGWDIGKVVRRGFVYGCRMSGIGGTRGRRGSSRGGGRDASDRVLEFRICQFSIQGNHIHLICEASDNDALARGIQGWSVRVARGVNRFLGREGSVFDDRYHMRVLKTPTDTRHALCYVLQNARRHGERLPRELNGIDPFSSAWWFDGWKDDSWREGIPPPEDRSVAEPKTWLLRVGWRRSKLGLIYVDEVPPAGRR